MEEEIEVLRILIERLEMEQLINLIMRCGPTCHAGILSLNFSLTITTMDMMNSFESRSGVKLGQR